MVVLTVRQYYNFVLIGLLLVGTTLIIPEPNKSNGLCPMKHVDPYYTGVFLKRTGQDYLTAQQDLNSFKQIVDLQRQKGFGLIDIDPLRGTDASKVLWAGVWHKGLPSNEFHAELDLDSFVDLSKKLRDQKAMMLIDAASYSDSSGNVWWAGVWSPTGKKPDFVAGADWKAFADIVIARYEAGFTLIDVEAYYDNGLKWAGVWRTGHDANYIYAGREWNSFVELAEEKHKKGLDLIDVTTYGGSNFLRQWVGVWVGGHSGNYVTPGQDWNHFVLQRDDFAKKGYVLIDMEAYLPILKGESGYVPCDEPAQNPVDE